MIELNVEPYCHKGCRDFEPKAICIEDEAVFSDWGALLKPTEWHWTVECRHKDRCNAIYRYFERRAKSDGAD